MVCDAGNRPASRSALVAPGAAVTRRMLRVSDVHHEFSAIECPRDADSGDPFKIEAASVAPVRYRNGARLRLEHIGEGTVTADIICHAGVGSSTPISICSPLVPDAHVKWNSKCRLGARVQPGQKSAVALPIGELPIDAIFQPPVRRVGCDVDPGAHDGTLPQLTTKLILEITEDGRHNPPEDAD